MATIFTKIRTQEIPGYILEDTGEFFALLDVFPKQKGHTLVIPHQEVDYIFDLDSETYHKLWVYVAQVAKKLKQVVPCRKIAIVVEGMQVSHTHIHLIPINHEGDLLSKYDTNPQELSEIQSQYRQL
jgi:histidine triad (HIT) family protein